ncbi:MAG: alanine--tRNA ligase [Candidatus Binataceae bacterium]
MRWTTDHIRQSFLDFFEEHGHRIVPSASLIPQGDPTLLFTNAGMVQFKNFFLGIRTPTDRRVADCQKCLRISGKHNDLEAVGRDSYHHTFFEMLGNWSFGDYYKREAIQFHWELITRVWEIPPEKLWATVYKDDAEAEQAWLELGYLPRDRVLRFGEKDNFWEMGETGPCGPCSEIHIDRGAGAAEFCAHPNRQCGVNVDGCARFIELANLVFIQYDRDPAGKLAPLPMKHVDTGTGLERVAAVLQSIETGKLLGNYDIDVFAKIIGEVEKISECQPADETTAKQSGPNVRMIHGAVVEDAMAHVRAVADHARAITFLIAEGLRPGHEKREYVLKKLIYRTARRRRPLLINEDVSLLAPVCDSTVEAMKVAYPELQSQRRIIKEVVENAERQAVATVTAARQLLQPRIQRMLANMETTLSGKDAFELYDTYGLSLEEQEDELKGRNQGLEINIVEFNRLMEEQRERARAARDEKGSPGLSREFLIKEAKAIAAQASNFVGYDQYETESNILSAPKEDKGECLIVTAETPFYPEGGGQIGDRGVIESRNGGLIEVLDTKRHGPTIVHIGRMLRGEAGEFETGKRVTLMVDRERRTAAMLNHSATHVLHYALREILGNAVHQAGSLVAPGRLRFDFSHNGPVSEGDLAAIEEEINARIRENASVTIEEMAYNDAIKVGALAFFGDKYGDYVRVIRMGGFSTELCGGTHVGRTGDIGFFKLEAETGVAAGVRRIEAFTGQGALEAIRRREKLLEEIGGHLGARDGAALERLERILAREKELEKKLRALEQKLIAGESPAAGDGEIVRERNGVKVVTRKVAGIDARGLREMADRMRQKHGSAIVAIGSDPGDGKAALVVAVTADLASRLKAGDIIKKIAPIVGGAGGGRPDFAQAGGRDPGKLDAALEAVFDAIP